MCSNDNDGCNSAEALCPSRQRAATTVGGGEGSEGERCAHIGPNDISFGRWRSHDFLKENNLYDNIHQIDNMYRRKGDDRRADRQTLRRRYPRPGPHGKSERGGGKCGSDRLVGVLEQQEEKGRRRRGDACLQTVLQMGERFQTL